jgi:sortase A
MYSLFDTEEVAAATPIPPSVRRAWWLEGLLLGAGFLCLCWVGGTYGRSYLYQSYESYKLDQVVHGRKASAAGWVRYAAFGDRPELPVVIPSSAPKSRVPVMGADGLIGRLEMARLNVSAVVQEGVDDKTLSRAIGHVPDTALPGQIGNFSVAAHRDTFFRGLRNVKVGDVVRMVTPGGNFVYSVEWTKIVRPENVEVLDPTDFPAITMVTCYPFNYVGSAPKRFIVRGRLMR